MQSTVNNNENWTPRIVAFFCNWCTYTASDLAGVSRLRYAPSTRVIRVMCSGRIDPEFIMEAFAKGADGVLIGGCHPGDCHYAEGNYKCLRRFTLLQKYAKQMGIEQENLFIKELRVDKGIVMKRMMPAAMGTGHRINKRTSHLNILLAEKIIPVKKTKKVKK